MTHRIGVFFILMGVFLVALFVFSIMAQTPGCGFLLTGGALLGFGVFLWFRDPPQAAPDPGRFRLLKRAGKRREREKKK